MTPLPKVILFDADGTLYDSSRLHHEAYSHVAHKLYGFDFPWELWRTQVMHGTLKPVEVLRAHGVDVDDDQFHQHKRAHYEGIASKRLIPMPGLSEFLSWCREQGIRCYVVSAASRHSLETSLRILGIDEYFEDVVGHEDVGDKRKPHPYPYTRGLEMAGVLPSEAIAIEDAPHGITSAKAAGLSCVGILNQTNTAKDLEKADHIIETYEEFRKYLLSL